MKLSLIKTRPDEPPPPTNTTSALAQLDGAENATWRTTPRARALVEEWDRTAPSRTWPSTEVMLIELEAGVDEQHGGPLVVPELSWQDMIGQRLAEKQERERREQGAALLTEAEAPEPVVETAPQPPEPEPVVEQVPAQTVQGRKPRGRKSGGRHRAGDQK